MSPVITRASDGTPAVSYALADAGGRLIAERRARTVFYSASTVKLGLMLAVVLADERGSLSLGDRVPCVSEWASAPAEPSSDGSTDAAAEMFVLDPEDRDPQFPADGELASIGELTTAMIRRSSNEATNMLFDLVGASAIADAFALCGAAQTRMERRIGDERATRAGLTNETTAADLVTVMHALLAGEVTSRGHADWMRDVLAGQEHPRIGGVVAAGTAWGSKSGDVPGIEHDVAFVGDGPARRYLAVCTRAFEPEQGRETIAAVAQALLV